LVSNAAACFASGLARSLALAAATVFRAFAKVACFDCLNVFHDKTSEYSVYEKIISHKISKVNTNFQKEIIKNRLIY
jgi:hypothetical protein